jgi:flagellar biosynthesis/type III secretory pathway chaperone
MNELLDELSSVLEREIGCYEELIESARAEQQALIRGKLHELKLAIEAQELLVASTKALEETRRHVGRTLAERFGWPPGEVTLTRLIELGYDDEAGRIAALRDKVRQVVRELDRVNVGNAQLINSSIEFVNQTMWVLLQPRGDKPTYAGDGSAGGRAPARALVDRLG